MIKKDVQFMGHDISKASVFVNLAKHNIAKVFGKNNCFNLTKNYKRKPISPVTPDSSAEDILKAINEIPIINNSIDAGEIKSEDVVKYICGPRGAAAMLAKSVITKSKNDGGFKKLVSNELKNISSQKTNESSAQFMGLNRHNLCEYITKKKRGKQEDGKDARIADWLKYLCALLVLYVTKKTTDGSGEIPGIAASNSEPSTQQNQENLSDHPETLSITIDSNSHENANRMYGMLGNSDVPLDPGNYEDEPPTKPPCDAMPIQQDPPISTVSLGQQLQHQPSKPNPATQATLELSMPQHHPIPKTDISQKPYIPIDNQLPPTNVSLNQQPTTNIPKYRLVADLTTNEKDTILKIAQKLADLTTAQPMLSQDDFATQARQTAPINSCKETASYNFIKINQVTSNEGTTITYGTKYDQNCTLKRTLDDYHTCRKSSQANQNICLQLIALSAGPCTFATNNENPQLEIVKKNNEFVEKVKTALFPTHQNQQPQPYTYPTHNQTQYQQAPFTHKSPQQLTPPYPQTQYPQPFPQTYQSPYQQPTFTQKSTQQFNQGFPQQNPINQYIPQLQQPTHIVTQTPQQTQFTQQSTQQNPMNQYIPKLQPQTHTVTPNPQQTPSTHQPTKYPMNQNIPQLQPPTQTVTPNPQLTQFNQQSTQYPLNQYIPQLQPPPQTVTPNQQQQGEWNHLSAQPTTQPAQILLPEQQLQINKTTIQTYTNEQNLNQQKQTALTIQNTTKQNPNLANELLTYFRDHYRDENFTTQVQNSTYLDSNHQCWSLPEEWKTFLYYAKKHKIRTMDQLYAIPQNIQKQRDTLAELKQTISTQNNEQLLEKFQACIVAHFDFTPGDNLETRVETLKALLYDPQTGKLNQLAKNLVATVTGPATLTSQNLNTDAINPHPLDPKEIDTVNMCLDSELITIPQPDGSPFLPGDKALTLYNKAFGDELSKKIYHIFMAASQTNGLESCDNEHAPLYYQIYDPTQGPTSCSQAILAWIKRELMYENGTLKDYDTISLLLKKLEADSVISCLNSSTTDQGTWVASNSYYSRECTVSEEITQVQDNEPLYNEQGQPIPNMKYPVYQNGYFQPWTLNTAGKDKLSIAMKSVKCSYMSQDAQSNNGEQTFTQNFAAAFSYQGVTTNFAQTDYVMNLSWIYPQYDHIIKDAIIKSGNNTQYKVILVHLTNIGQGAFSNPKGIPELAISVAILANAEKLSGSNIVIRKDYNATDDYNKIRECLTSMLTDIDQQQLQKTLDENVIKNLTQLSEQLDTSYRHLCGSTIKCYEIAKNGQLTQTQQQNA